MKQHTIITMDGPSGTGKSTVARRVARELGYVFLDTGALYRGAALAIDEAGADPESENQCTVIISSIRLKLDGDSLFLDDKDITGRIRTGRIAELASVIAASPSVRELLLDIQRSFPEHSPIVAEGRDTGSVVFPDADIKLYLDASPEERAKRRFLEFNSNGTKQCFEDVLEDIKKRDYRDKNRRTAPLVVPEHATVVDTTHLCLEEVVDKVLSIIKKTLSDQ